MMKYIELLEKNRVLSCLYKIAQMAVDDSHSFDTTMQTIIDSIPQAFEAPEKIAAGIRLDENLYQTSEFDLSQNRYGKDIVVNGNVRGRVEVGCLNKVKTAPCRKKVYSFEEKNSCH